MSRAQKAPVNASILQKVEQKGAEFSSFGSASKKLYRRTKLLAFAARCLQHEALKNDDMKLAVIYDRAASTYAQLYVDANISYINKMFESFRPIGIGKVYTATVKTLKRLHLDETPLKTKFVRNYEAKTDDYTIAINGLC